jgi:osmotically-inducible protein OsmY
MTGTVNNLLSRQRAAKFARTVRGVRSVINRIKVRSFERTDEQIRLDVEQALQDDPVADINHLSVTVQNGTVMLNGRLDSWYGEELSLQIAKGVKGVRKVIPNFKVIMKARRPDRKIVSEIKRRLKWDVWVDEGTIDVKVKKGDVFLSGTVGTLDEKIKAYQDSWIAGVQSVTDRELFVDRSKHNHMRRRIVYDLISDEEIKNAIKDAFTYDPRVSPLNLDISVKIGVVAITGDVNKLESKRAAEQDAKNTVGVWHVKNNLKVCPDIGINPADDTETVKKSSRTSREQTMKHQYIFEREQPCFAQRRKSKQLL